jgi:primosomal protein N' (replication factor Y)
VKGKYSNSIIILGSATPSLESYHNALKKKYSLCNLPQRVENKLLPKVTIIDMKVEMALGKRKTGILSSRLSTMIRQKLDAGEQCLLFLNRRGFSPAFICQQCGHTFQCPNCDVSLIHHREKKRLCCHYCDHWIHIPEECPSCAGYFLASLGWGTERLEQEIAHLFPDARTARMDRDTATSQAMSRGILRDVYRGDVDILIGTQMIVKGLHLPLVTLVGVISADQSLNFPDYRAGERTFQLLTQVAGRAGRGDIGGQAFIQTYNPSHYSIVCAQDHDYSTFYEKEIEYRRELGYPPFARIVNFRFEGTSMTRVESCARAFGNAANTILKETKAQAKVTILGPAQAPWKKIKGRYRYQMLVKGNSLKNLRSFTSRVLENVGSEMKRTGVKIIVDVDPQFTL